jgi:hypothetical protein
LPVGFQTNGKTREAHGGSEKGIKKAAGCHPGVLWGWGILNIGYWLSGYLAIYV